MLGMAIEKWSSIKGSKPGLKPFLRGVRALKNGSTNSKARIYVNRLDHPECHPLYEQ